MQERIAAEHEISVRNACVGVGRTETVEGGTSLVNPFQVVLKIILQLSRLVARNIKISLPTLPLQRREKWLVRGWVKYVPALA